MMVFYQSCKFNAGRGNADIIKKLKTYPKNREVIEYLNENPPLPQ